MSVARGGVLLALVADVFGWGATLNPDGSVLAITGPTMRVVTGANPTNDDNLGSTARRVDAGNVGLWLKTAAGGAGWTNISNPFSGTVPSGAQLTLADNVNPAWSVGAAGALDMLVFDTSNGAERITFKTPGGTRINSGGLNVQAGGVTVQAGGVTVQAGGVSLAGALVFQDALASVSLVDNQAVALQFGSAGAGNILTITTTDGSESVNFNTPGGTRVVSGGLNVQAGGVSLAGSLTFQDSLASITLVDNQAVALQIGAAGALNILTITTTNGAEVVNVNAVNGLRVTERTFNVANACVPKSAYDVVAALRVSIIYPGGVNTTSIAMPARTGGWRVVDAYLRSGGATGGTATVQNHTAAAITNAMVPGNADIITRAASINNGNAVIAGGNNLSIVTILGTPSGEAFISIEGL